MKPRLTKKRFRDCEFVSGKKSKVLELTFKHNNDRVMSQIKDIATEETKYIKRIIESARNEAEKYFLNKQSGLILKK